MTTETLLHAYEELPLVFYPARQKAPQDKDWPTRQYSLTDYRPGDNIGVKLGVEVAPGRFLADADIDWVCNDLLPLLPRSDFRFGRRSKPLSHILFTTPAPVPTVQYKDNKTVLIECRGTKTDGTIGMQTMMPPSIHPEGEQIEPPTNPCIGHVEDGPERIRNYAIAAMLVRHLGPHGFDHDARLAVAGFLLQLDLEPNTVRAICRGVATATGNDTSDSDTAVRSTEARLQNGGPVTGAGELAKLIDGKAVAEIRRWIKPEADVVVMAGGRLTAIVDRAESALLDHGIYQRSGALIHPVRLDRVPKSDVRRDIGATVLTAVKEAWLLEQMGRALYWQRSNGSAAEPQALYGRTLLARGEWRFPVLRSVVTAPTLALDGRIIQAPGYDEDSHLLLDLVDRFPPVPVFPTQDDARAALERLERPLRGFPFVDDAAKSVALAAILTALVRPSLETAPLHAFDAPTAGTGKSMLAELVGLLATGVRPPALNQGKSPEEDEKRLSTVLAAGDSVIHIDNCDRTLTGDFLCSMLTQTMLQARILGQSERRLLPSTTLVLASGNNLEFAGDIARRVVLCRLDSGEERPDSREFDFDCHAEVRDNRPELVVDGLTVLRAYRKADSPVKLPPMGSFTDWEWIRGALVWLGRADPADTRAAILDADPRKDELIQVMDFWETALGDKPVEVVHIERGGWPNLDVLRDKLVEVACRGQWSSKSVGWWLKRHKDRWVGGRCFRSAHGRRQYWRLEGGQVRLPEELPEHEELPY